MHRRWLLLIFGAFLIGSLFVIIRVAEGEVGGPIYIRADGAIDPPSAPIERSGDLYTFTDNINGSIIVEKDNIVIDGNHSALHGFDVYSSAFSLDSRCNVTIRNISIDHCMSGFDLHGCSDCKIYSNSITNTTYSGILLSNDTHTYIYENNVTGSLSSGIELYQAVNNNLQENLVDDSWFGIRLWNSSGNILRNNTMVGNTHNFGVTSLRYTFARSELINDVDASNTVNGKPIYYWVNEASSTVPPDAGCVVLVNCTDILVEGLSLHNNSDGLLLAYTSSSTIHQNDIADNRWGAGINSFLSMNNTITENNLTTSYSGLDMYRSSHNRISRNKIVANRFHGIRLDNSSNFNYIRDNYLTANKMEIWLRGSSDNVISNNTLSNSQGGLGLWQSHYNLIFSNTIVNSGAIGFTESYENQVLENVISNTHTGVFLGLESGNNTFYRNTITKCYYGIVIDHNNGNIFFHNNLIDNDNQVYKIQLYWSNSWNITHEGNFWSDYSGDDLDYDGIGDTPYIIDANNIDHYPLMGMFSSFNVTSEHQVQTICNSTISGFQHNGTAISFDVIGENGSVGFCRTCIPTALMNDYQIFVNGTEVEYNLLPVSNSTHSFLYFTYEHSTKEVVIIPELPLLTLLPFFMLCTLLATVFYRRKQSLH